MDQFQAMRVFAKVAEQGSFVRAAQQLDMSAAAATRHIGDLESHLGIRLLHRTTRRLSLTEAGQAYLQRVTQILAEVEEANAVAMSHSEKVRGTLQIYSQLSFGESQLSGILKPFKDEYPSVALDVTLTDRTLDLVDEGFDVGFFLSMQRFEASMIARQLGVSEVILCASPAYLERYGTPQTPEELTQHSCINFSYEHLRHRWTIEGPHGEVDIPIKSDMVSNNGELLRQCAVDGMGIVMRPTFSLRDDLTSGRLVRLLPGYHLGRIAVSMVYPSRRFPPAKVTSFVDFVSRRFPRPERDPWIAADSPHGG